ncbi:uncharacterized protein LOC119112272 [Pollicipes pollicipes]|uniref:uncharacterized protein LOC119112272 n=1 Tax=Pollicipes pollicipes TaxID=41117 RepID=UPI001884B96E|nr:uncharacterized protein LOC119112272 [Pollicipes pollicipes]
MRHFGHYANYEQTQHHLHEERLRGAALVSRLEEKFWDEARCGAVAPGHTFVRPPRVCFVQAPPRRQHQVGHSQRGRRAKPSAAEWPISNYYEYESVRVVPHGGGGSGVVDPTTNHSLPRHHERTRSGPATGNRAAGAGRAPGPATACDAAAAAGALSAPLSPPWQRLAPAAVHHGRPGPERLRPTAGHAASKGSRVDDVMLDCWSLEPAERPSLGRLMQRLDMVLAALASMEYVAMASPQPHVKYANAVVPRASPSASALPSPPGSSG